VRTTVVNVSRGAACDVYIGRTWGGWRRSVWANPFRVGRDGTRAECVEKYRAWIQKRPALLARVGELRGKRLGCWCVGRGACHGHVLAELAELAELADREEDTDESNDHF
jgi:hypothetical protein